MKEEIKEILVKLKKLCYDDYCLEFSVDYIDRKEEKLLLDYITNLQEEVYKLTAECTEWESKYYDLQEVNVHLDKVNCYLRKKINNDIYKLRIEKAIDFMNNTFSISNVKDMFNIMNELENILKGDEK